MFALLLAAVSAIVSVPAPTPTVTPLPATLEVTALDAQHVALWHVDGSLTIATLEQVVVLAGPMSAGWPPLGLNDSASPHVFETQYSSARGSHTVRTPCSNYTTVRACAEAHERALEALQGVFPKV